MLVLQIVQTRVLSVIAWYYLAFFAISVAMLGMTVGAVWIYLRRERIVPAALSSTLADAALLAAVSMPASLMIQFSLITGSGPSLATVVSWSLLLVAMAVPYVLAGVVVSLALTRSPYPVSQVYGVDLIGAALGCVAVIAILNLLDGPSAIIFAGAIAGLAAVCFDRAATPPEQESRKSRRWWQRPAPVAAALLIAAVLNHVLPISLQPLMIKDHLEVQTLERYEKWNSYSRIDAFQPETTGVFLWAPSPTVPPDLKVPAVTMTIDGAAGTMMPHYDGTRQSIDYLHYDLTTLAYRLPDLQKAAVIGVGGGRDVLTAHLFGVPRIVGVELNPIFIHLDTEEPVYSAFSNLGKVPGLELHVDDARSWFASTAEKFDIVQMSMIDTWAATGAGAFSLSENGLYTLQGWRAFLNTLTDHGVFTVSRWYAPANPHEAGRMIALATAALLDAGIPDAKSHLFVARSSNVATLVLSKSAFTPAQLRILHDEVARLDFKIMLAPDQPDPGLLGNIVAASTLPEVDRAANQTPLDLSVPTDNRPFFFNQLRFHDVPRYAWRMLRGGLPNGVIFGNLRASIILLLILGISIVAVVCAILLPLRRAATQVLLPLIVAGTTYFGLIGMGFMLAEISMLEYFGVFLGHPIYSLGVCLFSLILATGLGSLASGRLPLSTGRRFVTWGLLVGGYLLLLQWGLIDVFRATTGEPRVIRILISLAIVMPLGFALGFAFPTGMRMVEAIDARPTAWFWGINGAAGVLASVLAVMLSMAWGINVTLTLAALCYLALIPIAGRLLAQAPRRAVATEPGTPRRAQTQ